MTPEEAFDSLPAVVPDVDASTPGGMEYVKVGEWSFCVQDDIEHNQWWEDAKILIAYAQYLDQIKAERGL